MPIEVPPPAIAGVRLRAVEAADEPFLRALYRDVRSEELAVTGWDQSAKDAFCDSQFALQDRHYREHYPEAALLVIERDGVAVGRLYVDRVGERLQLMDLALVREARGKGLGSGLLAWLLDWARREGRDVGLYVEAGNPARRLYLRSGFADDSVEGPYLGMRWKAATPG